MKKKSLYNIGYAFIVAVAVPIIVYATASIPAACTTPGDCKDITPTFTTLTVKGHDTTSSVVGTLNTTAYSQTPVIRGNYVYFISYDKKFTVADISDPASPVVVGQTTPPTAFANPVQGPTLAGKYAFVADNSYNSFYIFDVSDPTNPVYLKLFTSFTGYPSNNQVQGKYLYIGGGCCGGYPVNVFDISNPLYPTLVSHAGTVSQYASYFTLAGEYLYYVNYTAEEFQVVDIRDASHPQLRGSLSVSGIDIYGSNIDALGKYAYVASQSPDRLYVIDVSDPDAPEVSGYVSATAAPRSVVVEGKYAYMAQTDGVAIYDVSDASAPTYIGMLTSTSTAGLAISGRYAFTSSGEVLDLGGTYIQELQAGGISVDTLTVGKEANFRNSLNVHGALTVGTMGLMSTGPVGIFSEGGGADVLSVTAGRFSTTPWKTAAFSTATFTNRATSTGASLIKAGIKITSTGSWTGASASNIGLYISSITGGTNNYDAIFNGGGNVGIGTLNPTTTLEVVGTISGSVLKATDLLSLTPRSAAPSSPSAGWMYYDSDSNELCLYDGSSWVGLKAAGACM